MNLRVVVDADIMCSLVHLFTNGLGGSHIVAIFTWSQRQRLISANLNFAKRGPLILGCAVHSAALPEPHQTTATPDRDSFAPPTLTMPLRMIQLSACPHLKPTSDHGAMLSVCPCLCLCIFCHIRQDFVKLFRPPIPPGSRSQVQRCVAISYPPMICKQAWFC